MELSDILRLLNKGKWFIIAATVLGVLAGYASSLVQTPMYRSTAQVYVAVRDPVIESANSLASGSNVADGRADAYAQVIRTEAVMRPVADALGIGISPEALIRKVTATRSPGAPIITIEVTDPSPKRAADIANQVGASLGEIATTQLDPGTDESSDLVSVSTVTPAKAAAAPYAPNTRSSIGLGALGGLALGIAVAFLRAALDTRVHGPRDVEALTDAPILGTIGYDPNAKSKPLVVEERAKSPLAEAFRAMRTNLQFVGLESATRSFAITSAMPSEGKTTTVANLAVAIAESGSSVILVDADLRRPRVAEVMGIEGAAGVSDILIGNAELADVVQPWGRSALAVLPAGSVPPNPSELLGSAAMRALVDDLAARYDFVLFDAPPLLPVTDAAVLGGIVDGVLVVTAAQRSRRTQLGSALADLERIGARTLGIVLTMLPTKGGNAYGYGAYGGYYGSPQPEAESAQPEPRSTKPTRVGRRSSAQEVQ